MNAEVLLYSLLAIVAGMLVPLQTGYNVQLVRAFKSPLVASVVIFVVGAVALAAVAAVGRAHLPSRAEMASAPVLAWFVGGVLAAVYVVSLIFAAPRLGAGTLVVFVVFGQIACSMAIDQYGLLNFPVHPMSALRFLGIGLLIAGVALIKFF